MAEIAPLVPGDRIDVSVTHEVKIGRESSWIKLGINAAVQEGEGADQAVTRVSKLVGRHVIAEVTRHVEIVQEANEQNTDKH